MMDWQEKTTDLCIYQFPGVFTEELIALLALEKTGLEYQYTAFSFTLKVGY